MVRHGDRAVVVFALLVGGGAARADAGADARAVVQRWLEAQNQGDFAAYEKLYAPRFTGVRRSGPRVV